MKPKYHSNSDIFARRGNPWVSDREGRERFGRNLETEDPDLDCFTRARMTEHPYQGTRSGLHADILPVSKKPAKLPDSQSPARRFVSINAKLQKALRELEPVKVAEGKARPVAPTPAASRAKGKRYYLYAHTSSGEDIEVERDLLKHADKSFERFTNRPDVTKVELWSAWEGRVLQTWTKGGGRRVLSLKGDK